MKRGSEAEFGRALRDVDLRMFIYRPADARAGAAITQARPCDWMCWQTVEHSNGHVDDISEGPMIAHPTWFECKDTDGVNTFPFSDLRPGQLQGIREADRVGIPYWLAIYWRRHQAWTISDAAKVLFWKRAEELEAAPVIGGAKLDVLMKKSISRELLMTRFGVDSSKTNLASTLKNILLGEI